jgi:hypothetical protein
MDEAGVLPVCPQVPPIDAMFPLVSSKAPVDSEYVVPSGYVTVLGIEVVRRDEPSLVNDTRPSPGPPTTGLGVRVVVSALLQGLLMFADGELLSSRFISCAEPSVS